MGPSRVILERYRQQYQDRANQKLDKIRDGTQGFVRHARGESIRFVLGASPGCIQILENSSWRPCSSGVTMCIIFTGGMGGGICVQRTRSRRSPLGHEDPQARDPQKSNLECNSRRRNVTVARASSIVRW